MQGAHLSHRLVTDRTRLREFIHVKCIQLLHNSICKHLEPVRIERLRYLRIRLQARKALRITTIDNAKGVDLLSLLSARKVWVQDCLE